MTILVQETYPQGICDICGRTRGLNKLKKCTDCGKTFCPTDSALRRAEELGMWMEGYHREPHHWREWCRESFDREMAEPKVCSGCGQAKDRREFFWGDQCWDCKDFVCYECVRVKPYSGPGWETAKGIFQYKCSRHVGRITLGWKQIPKGVLPDTLF